MTHNIKGLDKAWEETGRTRFLGIIKSLKGENLSEIILNDAGLWDEAYDRNNSKEKVIICADERVLPEKDEFKVGIAGQLVLAGDKDKKKFIKQWKGKIKAVKSHDGCGAAAVAYKGLSDSRPVIPSDSLRQGVEESLKRLNRGDNYLRDPSATVGMTNTDLYGVVHSHNLAKALGAKFEHIGLKKMRGNKDFHDARMLFWSADPDFDPSTRPSDSLRMTKNGLIVKNSYFPPHFLANGLAFGLSEKYCAEELKILTGIALGNHGFGKLFNKKNPFYIISVGKNAKKLNELAKGALKELNNRVKFYYLAKN